MAFPNYATVAQGDDGVRADESPISHGGDWSVFSGAGLSGGLRISSNQIVGVGGAGTYNGSYWRKYKFSDAEIFLSIPTWADNMPMYMKLRLNPTNQNNDIIPDPAQNGYSCVVQEISSGQWNIYRIVNGTTTSLVQVTGQASLASGDSIGFSAIGSTLTGYRKTGAGAWTAVPGLTITDTTYLNGFSGFVFNDAGTTMRLSNFGFGGVQVPFSTVVTPDFRKHPRMNMRH